MTAPHRRILVGITAAGVVQLLSTHPDDVDFDEPWPELYRTFARDVTEYLTAGGRVMIVPEEQLFMYKLGGQAP